jgi:hypothetical protein
MLTDDLIRERDIKIFAVSDSRDLPGAFPR